MTQVETCISTGEDPILAEEQDDDTLNDCDEFEFSGDVPATSSLFLYNMLISKL